MKYETKANSKKCTVFGEASKIKFLAWTTPLAFFGCNFRSHNLLISPNCKICNNCCGRVVSLTRLQT